jgi:cell division protein FtsA
MLEEMKQPGVFVEKQREAKEKTKRSGGGLFDKLLAKTKDFIKDDMNVSDEDYIKP